MQAGCPYELDPRTLGTKDNKPELLDNYLIDGIAPSSTGRRWLDKILRLGSAFTAHPHIVPGTAGAEKRLVTWSWRRCEPSLLPPAIRSMRIFMCLNRAPAHGAGDSQRRRTPGHLELAQVRAFFSP